MKYDLSILIPARNEIFLQRTIEDILSNIEGNTEIIAVCDDYWPEPAIKDHPRVTLIHHTESIGQRSATNEAARVSQAKYLMKVDAHCSFDKGFDVKMMKEMQDNWTMIPVMRNLHAFDWICPEGHRRYQGPQGVCKTCGKETTMDIKWIGKTNPQSTAYYFDKDLHFQYHQEHKKKQVGDIVETMSAQGSCFMLTREKYFELNICDETWGSWGNQGTEVALKTWLSGGRLVVNKTTWYSHMFRTQDDFGFPYPLSGREVEHARKCSRDIFLNDKWPQAKYPLVWLIKKFNPPTWEIKEPTKGIVYFTDFHCDEKILNACKKQLKFSCNRNKLISVSLNKSVDLGENVVINAERGVVTYFKQILAGIEKCDSDIVYICEHDVLYHPSHFAFTPERKDLFYYNDNKWKVDYETGQTLFYHCAQVSGLCAYKSLLLDYYRWRLAKAEKDPKRGGYEPGTRTKQFELYNSEVPNIDIRHKDTFTKNRWSQEEFRDKSTCQGWKMSDEVPGWGITKGRFKEMLCQV